MLETMNPGEIAAGALLIVVALFGVAALLLDWIERQ